MEYGERLRWARKQAGFTQEGLAKESGVPQGTISKIERGDQLTSSYDSRLAHTLNVSAIWLSTGGGDPSDHHIAVPDSSRGPDDVVTTGYVANIRLPYTTPDPVPLISSVQAGNWTEAIDNHHPGDAEEWVPCGVAHGPRAYALVVEGDSMTSQFGKSYPHGCKIIVDPDRVGDVANGDRVVAKINGDNGVTFKVYVEDAGKRFLKPLNPQHPIITDEFRIIGKVIGKWEDE
jgi:SOS-response transcriptional repressor LexA